MPRSPPSISAALPVSARLTRFTSVPTAVITATGAFGVPRATISRALASSPSVLLADEPTGALDRKNSDNVSHLLREISKTSRIPVVLATHDEKVASVADQLIRLVGDGSAVVEKDLPA